MKTLSVRVNLSLENLISKIEGGFITLPTFYEGSENEKKILSVPIGTIVADHRDSVYSFVEEFDPNPVQMACSWDLKKGRFIWHTGSGNFLEIRKQAEGSRIVLSNPEHGSPSKRWVFSILGNLSLFIQDFGAFAEAFE